MSVFVRKKGDRDFLKCKQKNFPQKQYFHTHK